MGHNRDRGGFRMSLANAEWEGLVVVVGAGRETEGVVSQKQSGNRIVLFYGEE